MYGSGGGNTVCHLNTDPASIVSLFCGSSTFGTALDVDSDGAEFSSKAIEAGRGGKDSGELAGDKGSNPKGEHSGSGSKVSEVIKGDPGGGKVDSVRSVCGISGVVNTVLSSRVDDTGDVDEVAGAGEMVDTDVPRAQNG